MCEIGDLVSILLSRGDGCHWVIVIKEYGIHWAFLFWYNAVVISVDVFDSVLVESFYIGGK